MGDLAFRYRLSHREWRILASGGAGLEGEPAFHYLVGELSILVRGRPLWAVPYELSIADIALGFVQARASGFPETVAAAVVRETDGGLEVSMARDGGRVTLSSSLDDRREVVTKEDLVAGVEAFLRGLAEEIGERAPAALAADELMALEHWRRP